MLKHLANSLVSLGLMAGVALAGATLDVTPDDAVTGGDTVSVAVSGADAGDLVFVFAGEPGTTDFDKFTLDVDPFVVLPLGVADADGNAGFEVALPDDLPPDVSGESVTLQAVTVGVEFGGGGPPTTEFCVTNTDTLTFE